MNKLEKINIKPSDFLSRDTTERYNLHIYENRFRQNYQQNFASYILHFLTFIIVLNILYVFKAFINKNS